MKKTIIILIVLSNFNLLFSQNDPYKIFEKSDPTTNFCISHSGKLIASSGKGDENNNIVELWNIETAQWIKKLTLNAGLIRSITFSPDDTKLAISTNKNSIYILDYNTPKIVLKINDVADYNSKYSDYFIIIGLQFSNDGNKLISNAGGVIKIWDVNSGVLLSKIVSNKDNSSLKCYFTPDNKYVICGDNESIKDNQDKYLGVGLKLFDINSGNIFKSTIGHTNDYKSITFNNSGTQFISCSDDGCVKVWDYQNFGFISVIKGQYSDAAFQKNEDLIVLLGFYSLDFYSIKEKKILKSININTKFSLGLDVTFDKKYALVGTAEGLLKLYNVDIDVSSPKEYKSIGTSDFGINEITFSYTGNPSNKKFSDKYIEQQKILGVIGHACSKFIQDVDITNQKSYESELNRLCVLADKKLMIPKINIIQNGYFFENEKEAAIKYKNTVDIYKVFAEKFFIKNTKDPSFINSFSTVPLNISKYETDDEALAGKREEARMESKRQEIEAKNNPDKPTGIIRKYCHSKYNEKYEITMTENNNSTVTYKVYDILGSLKKTIQGTWTKINEGVYGPVDVITIKFTGINSGLPNMKFACQYDGKGSLQGIIDSQNNIWNYCR